MRIISRRTLREFWERHTDAKAPLMAWYRLVETAGWTDFVALRRSFPHADQVRVASGNTVTVFNIHGNDYRLIAVVKYRKHLVYTLMVLTHEEYGRGRWKESL